MHLTPCPTWHHSTQVACSKQYSSGAHCGKHDEHELTSYICVACVWIQIALYTKQARKKQNRKIAPPRSVQSRRTTFIVLDFCQELSLFIVCICSVTKKPLLVVSQSSSRSLLYVRPHSKHDDTSQCCPPTSQSHPPPSYFSLSQPATPSHTAPCKGVMYRTTHCHSLPITKVNVAERWAPLPQVLPRNQAFHL